MQRGMEHTCPREESKEDGKEQGTSCILYSKGAEDENRTREDARNYDVECSESGHEDGGQYTAEGACTIQYGDLSSS